MAEYNNADNSIENNLQMISVIDNQVNYGGYVGDMMIEEEGEILPLTNDDEGIESDIPNNVLVRRTTLSNSDMDGRACYIVSLVEVRIGIFGVRYLCMWCFRRCLMTYNIRQGTYDHVEIHKIHTPTTTSFKCFGCNALGQLRSIEACIICNCNLLK
ncbi:hypothetical protein JTB14_029035 [Gonioctena quinquepunctata]|nr:hypothetical protein JTB14_029035 [Gonioctena quinquepunctata]